MSGRERLGGATSGARGHKGHKGEMIVLGERTELEGHATTQAGRPRPAGLPYKMHPNARLLQASSFLLPLFVCSSFRVQNHHRHSHPSQA
jgi:hypothetical protein